MRLIILICLALLMSGCAEFQAIKQAGKSYSASAADESLKMSIWTACNATTAGALRRKFNTKDELVEFLDTCNQWQKGNE